MPCANNAAGTDSSSRTTSVTSRRQPRTGRNNKGFPGAIDKGHEPDYTLVLFGERDFDLDDPPPDGYTIVVH